MEQSYISEVKNCLENILGDNWEIELGIDTYPDKPDESEISYNSWVENLKPIKKKYTERIEAFGINIFDLLNSSVLVGEYLGCSNFNNEIASVQTLAESLINFSPSNLEIAEEFGDKSIIDLTRALVEAVKIYNELYEKALIKYTDKDEIFIGQFYSLDNFATHQLFHSDIYWTNQLRSFFSNIGLSILDLVLSPDEKDFERLQDLHLYCDSGVSSFTPLISTKCTFLKAKWLLRLKLSQGKTPVNIFGGKLNILNVDETLPSEFGLWTSHLKRHYEVDGPIPKRLYKIESYQDFDKMNLLDIHLHIKYFKDVQPNYEKLIKIKDAVIKRREFLSKKAIDTKLKFEVFSYNLASVYSLNNCFSLLISVQNKSPKMEQIENLYQEIRKIQAETKIRNFFADFKYLEFLVKILENEFDNRRVLNDTNLAREIVLKCQEIIGNYEKNILWAEANLNCVYSLSFDECLIESIEINGVKKIFIASSFVLPISEKKYKSDFNGLKDSLTRYSTSLQIFESVEEDIKNSRKSRWKQIEIIGVFTALISFLVSSLPAFGFVHNITEAGLFILTQAISLVLFVSLLLLIGRKFNSSSKQILPWASFLVLFLIFAWYSLQVVTERVVTRDEINLIMKQDSALTKKLDTNIHKFDSLFQKSFINQNKTPVSSIEN